MEFLLFPEIEISAPSLLPSDTTPSAIIKTHTSPNLTPHPVRDGSPSEGSLPLHNISTPATKPVVPQPWDAVQSTQCAVTQPEKPRNFREALLGINRMTKRLDTMKFKPIATPKVEGGNVVVEIEDSEVCKSILELQFSVVGQLFLQKGESPPTIRNMRERLELCWGFKNFRIVPRRNAVYHIILYGFDNQSRALSQGAVLINPGMIRFVRWVPGVNFSIRKVTSTQVWVRIFDLPMEYLINEQSLMDVAAGVGTPIAIDQKTLDLELGIYARFLVEVDLSMKLPDRILVKRLDDCNTVKDDFFVDVSYERLPYFCKGCNGIGHSDEDCKKNSGRDRTQTAGSGNKPPRRPDVDRGWTLVQKGRGGKPVREDVDKNKGAEAAAHPQPTMREKETGGRPSNQANALPVNSPESRDEADFNKGNASNEVNVRATGDKLIETGGSTCADNAVEDMDESAMSGRGFSAGKQKSVEGPMDSETKVLSTLPVDAGQINNIGPTQGSGDKNGNVAEGTQSGNGHVNKEQHDQGNSNTDPPLVDSNSVLAQAVVEPSPDRSSATKESLNTEEEYTIRKNNAENNSSNSSAVEKALSDFARQSQLTFEDSMRVEKINKEKSTMPAEVASDEVTQIINLTNPDDTEKLVDSGIEKAAINLINEACDKAFVDENVKISKEKLSDITDLEDGRGTTSEANIKRGKIFISDKMRSKLNVLHIVLSKEDRDLGYQDMDPNKIYFRDGEFEHASGMHFESKTKRYWRWVSNHPDDLRELFYLPSNNMLKLAVRGEMGANNKEVLQEDDWDRKTIYTEDSFGYRPDLLQLFRKSYKEFKIVEHLFLP